MTRKRQKLLKEKPMKFAQQMFIPSIALVIVISLGGGATRPALAQTFTLLHTFTGAPDGANPLAGLVQDAAGNFYGTTQQGGITGGLCANSGLNGCGTVFKLDPSGNETVLYRFTGATDGEFPAAGLVRDGAGNLYGTTQYGGVTSSACGIGCGTVFKLDPAGTLTVLHSPGSSEGLVMDAAGNLYGSTSEGIFKLDPAGTFTVLDSTATSGATLARDAAGNLYGTTGGTGTVFKLDTSDTYTTLYSFTGKGGDGSNPLAGVILDGAGNLYGTTSTGGAPNCLGGNNSSVGCGTVFKLTPAGAETVFSLMGANTPVAGLVRDTAGSLYGTAKFAGIRAGSLSGVVFEMDPNGVEKLLYTFAGAPDGYGPVAGLVRDTAGNLYGTAEFGGVSGMGTVFKVNPLGPQNFPLTVAFFGNGTVTGNGINCSSLCGVFFAPGTMVTLTAAPAAGSSFVGWSGACSGAGTCILTINSAQSVGATFNSDFSLSASALTPGTVSPGAAPSTSTVNVVPAAAGFFSAVALTCAVAPTPALAPTCSINPNSVMPGTPATLTVSTTGPTTGLVRSSSGSGLFYCALCLPLIGLVATRVGLGSDRKRRKGKLTTAALASVLFASLVFQLACGGGRNGGSKGTPAATYTITVTGTYSTGSLVHSTPTMLTVQ
jgi:uncharacterized repeat protein (TIGR03803 family)